MNIVLDDLPEELKRALNNYLEARKRHKDLYARKDEYASRSEWQQMAKKEDTRRRNAHNEAAKQMVHYGYAPRLATEDETLSNARNVVKMFIELS